MPVMTKPEITKKTSTPMKPPGTGRPAWNATTTPTAMARSPWMSGRRSEGLGAVPLTAGVPERRAWKPPMEWGHVGRWVGCVILGLWPFGVVRPAAPCAGRGRVAP
jgi:hypothetical protein